MDITINRFNCTDEYTVGTLHIDGKFYGFSMEDPIREEKIAGETAIPAGTYCLDLRLEGGMLARYQAKFGESHEGMLWLQDVPGFEYIYIHLGNSPKDSSGCILIANTYDARNQGVIGVSTELYKRVWELVSDALYRGERVDVAVS